MNLDKKALDVFLTTGPEPEDLETCEICGDELDDGPYVAQTCFYCWQKIVPKLKGLLIEDQLQLPDQIDDPEDT